MTLREFPHHSLQNTHLLIDAFVDYVVQGACKQERDDDLPDLVKRSSLRHLGRRRLLPFHL